MPKTKNYIKDLSRDAKGLIKRIGVSHQEAMQICADAQLISDFKGRDYISETDVRQAWQALQAAALDNALESRENQGSWSGEYQQLQHGGPNGSEVSRI